MSGKGAGSDTAFDVAVVGAGLVGAAIARELAGYQLSVALLEARDDVGDATSKANTAILHTGFDATPGTLESRLVRDGSRLLAGYARDTGIPVERTGALLVAWSDEEEQALPVLIAKAEANGYDRCRPVDRQELYGRVPALGEGARSALEIPDESITCTWTTTLALATDAVNRRCRLMLDTEVTGAEVGPRATVLSTTAGEVGARWVVNAAGLGGDVIDAMFGQPRFTIMPRRGELLVFDKASRALVGPILLPVPSARGKGVLISPTIYGNVLLGPTAEDLDDRRATSTSAAGLDQLLTQGRKLMPALLEEEITSAYAGLRPATEHRDYVIDIDPDRRYLVAGGIRSTGLSAGIAIARHVCGLLGETGLALRPRSELPDPPRMANVGEAFPRPYQQPSWIERDPAYGRIVCFCERVTDGEIRDACRSTLPAVTVEGLRRRTRAMNGRCQGFYCGGEVLDRFERHLGRPASARWR